MEAGCRAHDGKPAIDIAIPIYGNKSHISIDRRHGVIQRGKTTHAAAQNEARLREVLCDPNSTASDAWADTAHRSAANEQCRDGRAQVSRILRRKPAAHGPDARGPFS
jgi:transposase, IS5 family